MAVIEKSLIFEDVDLQQLFGPKDSFIELIDKRFGTEMVFRGNKLLLKGPLEEIQLIEKIFKELIFLLNKNKSLDENDVKTVLDLLSLKDSISATSFKDDNVIFYGSKDIIRARNPRQMEYYRKVRQNDLVFSIGPAGTGKTFLAVAMALQALRNNEVSRIIITRPAVEAGESLGFLPGDLKEKIDPYLRPLTDALRFMLTPEKVKSLMDKEIIEINPLAYMRGRTLNNSFIILDEAQNATRMQMKMFLTRLGNNSKAVVTGDVTQIDLMNRFDSGLTNARDLLQNIEGIEFVYFTKEDVVRHRLVAEIINAYEKENSDSND
jgi:phosphate starvation-inducible protein PhoH and related proteins